MARASKVQHRATIGLARWGQIYKWRADQVLDLLRLFVFVAVTK
jgi:hypothetical protein